MNAVAYFKTADQAMDFKRYLRSVTHLAVIRVGSEVRSNCSQETLNGFYDRWVREQAKEQLEKGALR